MPLYVPYMIIPCIHAMCACMQHGEAKTSLLCINKMKLHVHHLEDLCQWLLYRRTVWFESVLEHHRLSVMRAQKMKILQLVH